MKNLKTLLMFGFAAIIACGGFLVFGTSSVKAGNDMTAANTAPKPSATAPPKAPEQKAEVQQKQETIKTIVYYFHGNVRCPSCTLLEEYSEEAVKQGFPSEISSGKLEFRSVNVDEEANRHFITDYQLVSRSVVVSRIENGKEAEWKNLDNIWNLFRNRDKFIEYVRDETKKVMEKKG